MSVSLSPFAGAGAQFFDNNGVPLAGGLIYTYAAGSTTPLETYTTFSGNVANTNPIVLDSAGRLSKELWLTIGYGYKFVLQTSVAVQIGSWDNIPSNAAAPFANDASSISYEQGYSVTAGGFIVGVSYVITSVGTTNFVAVGAASNSVGVNFTATGVGSGTGTAELSRSVESRLRDTVSVLDFGADPTGTTDSAAAIQAAIDTGNSVYFPAGVYKTTTTLNLLTANNQGQILSGAGPTSGTGTGAKKTTIRPTVAVAVVINVNGNTNGIYIQNGKVKDLSIDMTNMTDATSSIGIKQARAFGWTYDSVHVLNEGTLKRAWKFEAGAYTTHMQRCSGRIVELEGISGVDAVTTISSMNCDHTQVYARYAGQCSWFMPVIQGALDKFDLAYCDNINIIGGDIEGSGFYLALGASVTGLRSYGNGFGGFGGTYLSGTPGANCAFNDFVSDVSISARNPGQNTNWIPQSLIVDPTGLAGVLYQNCGPSSTGYYTDLAYSTTGLNRIRLRNPNVGVNAVCDVNVSVGALDLYMGIDKSAALSYLDNRGFADFQFMQTGAGIFRWGTTGIYPSTDNLYTCGKSGNRWSEVWAANGTIQTSDAAKKTNVTKSDLGLSFIQALRPVSFRWIEADKKLVEELVEVEETQMREETRMVQRIAIVNGKAVLKMELDVQQVPVFDEFLVVNDDGTPVIDASGKQAVHQVPHKIKVMKPQKVIKNRSGKRTHYGLIAQEVKAALSVCGKDDAGFYIDDAETGEKGLRYDQLISPLIAAVQELSAQINELQNRS